MADDEGFFNAKTDCLHTLMGREALNRGSNQKRLKRKAWYEGIKKSIEPFAVPIKNFGCKGKAFDMEYIK